MTKEPRKSARRRIDFSTLDSLFGFRLRLAQVTLFHHFRDALKEFAITPGQAGLLILIRDNPGVSQSDLARAVRVERATLGQTIEGLVARRLVERRRNAHDRRAYALHLSADGEAFMAHLLPAIEAHEAAVSANLTPAEFARLRILLGKFLGRESESA